jgi:hypothetical protein
MLNKISYLKSISPLFALWLILLFLGFRHFFSKIDYLHEHIEVRHSLLLRQANRDLCSLYSVAACFKFLVDGKADLLNSENAVLLLHRQ